MRLRLFAIIFMLTYPLAAQGADFKMIPQLRSGSVAASANQKFGAGPGKSQKAALPEFSTLPQSLEASALDENGKERSARGKIRLDVESGALRFDCELEATDANLSDFIAPVVSVKGAVVVDLKALVVGDKAAPAKAKFRLVSQGPPALIGRSQEEAPPPESLTVQIRLNDEIILTIDDLIAGEEKEIPMTIHSGDVVTLSFQVDFSVLSAAQAHVTSALRYSFQP